MLSTLEFTPQLARAAKTADDAYNAGVTALSRNDTPSSIAHLITAKDLAPRDQEITAALSAARMQSASTVHAPAPWPVSATELAAALLLANVAFAVSIATKRRATSKLRVAQIVLAILVIALAGVWVARLQAPTYAVVAKTGVATYAANDTTSLERFPTHLGDELPVDTPRGDWLLVRGNDGTRAYIERSAVVLTSD